jgi:H+-translocating NAD(P) transhydrogenase subunit alpha
VSEETKKREHEHLHRLVAEADVVITTAQIPGRPAPVLITRDMVDAMKSGAIIVDLAAESGGNCELTRRTRRSARRVLILGPTDLAAGMPIHASQMYSRNIEALVQHIVKDGALSSTASRRDRARLPHHRTTADRAPARERDRPAGALNMAEGILLFIYIFVLAIFVGFEVITKVPQMLHTPLMSGSNAISGITLVGAVVVAGRVESPLSTALAVFAVAFATINVVGGFMVTDRMLQMFRRKPEDAR